jgi:hypothetical protein
MLRFDPEKASRCEVSFPYMLQVPLPGKTTAWGGSYCDKWVETLMMVQEGLLARLSQDGQQASIHIGIEAGVGKVGFQ